MSLYPGLEDDGRAIVVPEIKTPFVLHTSTSWIAILGTSRALTRMKLRQLGATLETKLLDFGVKGEVAIRPGPVITNVTTSRLRREGVEVAGLQDDIAMALKALRVRIIAPIPGRVWSVSRFPATP